MGHNLTRGDLALPFAPGENWPITQGFDKVFDENDKVVPGQVNYPEGGHEGIDWGCCSGTPIHAMAAGRVSLVDAGETKGGLDDSDYTSGKPYGNQVRVRTGTGTSGYELTYAHLVDVYVCVGQEVAQGQLLGLSGDTGRSSNPHLHVHLKPFGAVAATDKDPHGMSGETFLEGADQPISKDDRNKELHKNNHLRMILGTVDFSTLLPEVQPPDLPYLCPTAKAVEAVTLKTAPRADAADATVNGQPGQLVKTVVPADKDTEEEEDTEEEMYAVISKDADPNPQWWRIVVPGKAVGWVPNDTRTMVTHPDRVRVAHPPARHIGNRVPQARQGIDLRANLNNLEYINVRRTTTTTGNSKLGELRDRNWRTVSLWACDDMDKHGWFQIPIEARALTNPVNSEAVDGWVRDDVADLLYQPPKASANTPLQVRAWPDLGAASMGPLVAAQSYAIVGKSATRPVWWRIRVSASVTGWVHDNNVQTDGYLNDVPVQWPPRARIKTAADVTLHAGPAATYATVAALSGRDAVGLQLAGRYTINPTWWLVHLDDGSRGWVHEDDVRIVGDVSGVPIMWPPRVSRKAPAASTLSVHAEPGTDHAAVATIPDGSTAQYVILGKDAATPAWWWIRFSNTVTGWVDAAQMQTHGEISHVPVVGTAPTAVHNLTVTATDPTALHTDWQAPTGIGDATSYDVRYRIQDAAAWTTHAHAGTITVATLSGLAPDTTYEVRVRAVNTAGSGPWASVQADTDAARPQLSLLATTTDGLNVRSGPGTSHNIVASIAGDSTTRYDILGKDAATATWYQIQFSPTVAGWVSATYVQTHGSLSGLTVTWNPTPQLSLLATTTDGLNVRSVPSTGHNIIASIAGGSTTRYNILGKDAATATWYQIQFSPTVAGWVSATYVQTHGNLSGLTVTWNPTPQLSLLATTTINLNVRSGPGTSHGVVGSITGGSTTRYNILGKDAATATWYQIQFSPTVAGWVSATYVQTHGNLSGLTVTWNPTPQLSLLTTTTINLNVRSGPGTSHGVVGSITGGSTTRYDILGKDAATATWYQIRFSPTVTGWVSATYVQTHGSLSGLTVTWNPTPQLSLLTTTTINLNVRSGPGGTHGIVGTITGGSTTRYDILGKDAATATWYQIRFSPTVTGWVSATYVQTHGSLSGLTVTWNPTPQLSLLTTTTINLNVRSGPGTSHGVVGSITGGSTTRYDILGKDAATATWYQIRFSPTVTGWVSATYVQTHGDLSGLTVTWNPPRLSLLATTTAGLNVRSGPGGTHGIVGTITGGSTTRYDILGKDAATATWYQIRFSPTVTGWVSATYVQTHGSLSGLTVTWNPPRLSLLATTTAGLNVRSGPGGTHGIVGTIIGGSTTRYDILGKDAATATWYQIRFSPTVTGWVSATYVQTHGSLSGLTVTWNPPRLSLLATTTAGLNVRSGPGGTHGIVGTIIGGSTTRYDILGKDAATATWYQIQFSSTVTGWVSATYVQTHGDLSGLTVTWTPPQLSLLATTTQNLNVRSGPGTSHSVVGTITGGSTTRYDILGKDAATATWYQIQFSSTVTGWVHKDYIQTHGSLSGLTVTWTPPQLSLLATTTQNLNVRSGPGTSHSVVGTITGGSTTRYDILGKNAATATWYQIQFSSTVTGWVFATYVQTHGDVSGVPVR